MAPSSLPPLPLGFLALSQPRAGSEQGFEAAFWDLTGGFPLSHLCAGSPLRSFHALSQSCGHEQPSSTVLWV